MLEIGRTVLKAEQRFSTRTRCFSGLERATERDEDLPKIFAGLRDDPAHAAATRNLTFGKKGVLDRPRENIKTTCNHCITVCSGPPEMRRKWMDLLFSSGTVELDEEGHEVVVKVDAQGNRPRRRAVPEVN